MTTPDMINHVEGRGVPALVLARHVLEAAKSAAVRRLQNRRGRGMALSCFWDLGRWRTRLVNTDVV